MSGKPPKRGSDRPDHAQSDFLPDERLDFLSKEFDPVLALTTPGVKAPLADAPPLNNLNQCRYLLPETHEQYYHPSVNQATIVAARQVREKKRRLAKAHSGPPTIARFTTLFQVPKSLQCMADTPGPLSVLVRLFQQKKRTKVWIRRFKGIRGTCTGFLRAFDKHMNLVMFDVDEDYTVLVRKSTLAARSSTVKPQCAKAPNLPTTGDKRVKARCKPKNKTANRTSSYRKRKKMKQKKRRARANRVAISRHRHLKQILIRGDNIVMLSAA